MWQWSLILMISEGRSNQFKFHSWLCTTAILRIQYTSESQMLRKWHRIAISTIKFCTLEDSLHASNRKGTTINMQNVNLSLSIANSLSKLGGGGETPLHHLKKKSSATKYSWPWTGLPTKTEHKLLSITEGLITYVVRTRTGREANEGNVTRHNWRDVI